MRLLIASLALAALLPAGAFTKPTGQQGGQQGGQQAGTTPSQNSTGGQQNSPTATSSQNQSASSSTAAYESQYAAFTHLDDVTALAAKGICGYLTTNSVDDDTHTILIYDQNSFASVPAYEAFVESANAIISAYNSLLPKPKSQPFVTMSGGGGGGGGGIDPIADATGLIQAIAVASTTETPGSVVVPDSAVAVSLTKQLKTCTKAAIAYSPIFGKSSNSSVAQSVLYADLNQVNAARAAAHQQLRTSANTDDTGQLKDFDTLYDNFIGAYFPPQASSPTNQVVQGYQLAELLSGTIHSIDKDGNVTSSTGGTKAFVVIATVVAGGGTTYDHTDLLHKIYGGDEFKYSGGAVVEVAAWQSGLAQPLYANILSYRVPFTTFP